MPKRKERQHGAEATKPPAYRLQTGAAAKAAATIAARSCGILALLRVQPATAAWTAGDGAQWLQRREKRVAGFIATARLVREAERLS